jgi:hypothetical protein
MTRQAGIKNKAPGKSEWIVTVDATEDALIEMVGRISIPDAIRDELALIADPLFKLLREVGRR